MPEEKIFIPRKRFSQINRIRHDWSDSDFESIYNSVKEGIVNLESKIEIYMAQNPQLAILIMSPSKIDPETKRNVGGYDGNPSALITAMYTHLDYIFTIRTKAQHDIQLARCEEMLFGSGKLEMPLSVFFDPQMEGVNPLQLMNTFPTFYSYFEPKLYGTEKGGFGIAFPPRITELSDDELRIAMAHEYGHIKQGHCLIDSIHPYTNCAMDYAINHQFKYVEKVNYNSVADKLFNGGRGCCQISWAKKDGGEGIDMTTSPNWRENLGLLELIRYEENPEDKKKKEEKGAGGEPPPPPDTEVRVGDLVYIRGTKSPKEYGRVISIDSETGETKYFPVTEAEVQAELKTRKERKKAES